MENLKDWLLGLDALIFMILIFGGFVLWELKSGEFPLRWFGSIHRDHRPLFYWMGMLVHFAILGVMVYAWSTGLRLPISDFFDYVSSRNS
ncbi:MAG: hypothetical protein H6634_07075 [Anaerolineales bacterium]|nr:hypothetical protein [Anaerolineales bacterium]